MNDDATSPAGDPLVRPPLPLAQRLGLGAALVAAAIVLHVLATGAISGASWVIGLGGTAAVLDEPVNVDIIDQPDDDEQDDDQPDDEAGEEVEEEAEKVVEEEAEKVVEETKPERPPRADPVERKPDPTPEKPVRRTVGLNLESTVEGGPGDGYSIGNTRMGKTAREAADPSKVDPDRGPAAPPPKPEPKPEKASPNRKATNIPGSKAVLVKPKRSQRVEPDYPPLLRARGVEGTVVVRVSIDASGKVTKVEIIAPASEPEFNEAARAAALRERFNPATRDGVPIPFTLSFSYRFRLND